MLVKDIMSNPVISIYAKSNVGEAIEIMKVNAIRHLPVIDAQNKLLGIIAERDILKVFPKHKTMDKFQFNLLSRTPVTQIMSTDLVIACPSETLEKLIILMEKRDVGCIPVVECNKLVGLVSEADVFNTFVGIMGIENKGLRITIKHQKKRGFLAELVKFFDQIDAIIYSFVTFPNEILLKIEGTDLNKIVDGLTLAGFDVIHFSEDKIEEKEKLPV